MIQIRPVSDLRNKFPDVEKAVACGEPVYLTKNGYGAMVVLSLEAYSRLTDGIEAALDMADKVIAESIEATQNHIRRFKADGTVRGGGNSLCSALYDVKRVHRRRAVKH